VEKEGGKRSLNFPTTNQGNTIGQSFLNNIMVPFKPSSLAIMIDIHRLRDTIDISLKGIL